MDDVNGEGIYGTRLREPFSEGETVRFTRSKDGHTVYAFVLKWPGKTLHLRSIKALEGSEIVMLGDDRPLEWTQDDDGLQHPASPGAGGSWRSRLGLQDRGRPVVRIPTEPR